MSHDVDVGGVVLSAAALTSLTLALIQGATWGWDSTAVIALLVGSVVLFAAFALDERRSSHPLVDFGEKAIDALELTIRCDHLRKANVGMAVSTLGYVLQAPRAPHVAQVGFGEFAADAWKLRRTRLDHPHL